MANSAPVMASKPVAKTSASSSNWRADVATPSAVTRSSGSSLGSFSSSTFSRLKVVFVVGVDADALDPQRVAGGAQCRRGFGVLHDLADLLADKIAGHVIDGFISQQVRERQQNAAATLLPELLVAPPLLLARGNRRFKRGGIHPSEIRAFQTFEIGRIGRLELLSRIRAAGCARAPRNSACAGTPRPARRLGNQGNGLHTR